MTLLEHYEEERNIGREEGLKEGLKEGISGTVEILREMCMDDGCIVLKIMEKYHLSRYEAEEYIKEDVSVAIIGGKNDKSAL